MLLSICCCGFPSYILQLRVPTVSLTMENIADFISAYIIGNLLQMAFRFCDVSSAGCSPKRVRPATRPGIRRRGRHRQKIFEDALEGGFEDEQRPAAGLAQPGQPVRSAGRLVEPRVSKTSLIQQRMHLHVVELERIL